MVRIEILQRRVKENPNHSLVVSGMELHCQACQVTLASPQNSTSVRSHCNCGAHNRNLERFRGLQRPAGVEAAANVMNQATPDNDAVTRIVARMMVCTDIPAAHAPFFEAFLNEILPGQNYMLDEASIMQRMEEAAHQRQETMRQAVQKGFHSLAFDDIPFLNEGCVAVVASYAEAIDQKYKPTTAIYDVVSATYSGPKREMIPGDFGSMVLRALGTSEAWGSTVAIISNGREIFSKAWRDMLRVALPGATWVSCMSEKLAKISHAVQLQLPYFHSLINHTDWFFHSKPKKWDCFMHCTAKLRGSSFHSSPHPWEARGFNVAFFWKSRIEELLAHLNCDDEESSELDEGSRERSPTPADNSHRQRLIELLTDHLKSLKAELNMIVNERTFFCRFLASFQVHGRAFDMYSNYRQTTDWLSRLPAKYPDYADFWTPLYNEWKSYEAQGELREMFDFFRNVRVLDPLQASTVPLERNWPKDEKIRDQLQRWYHAEGRTCHERLGGKSAEEYWQSLQGYGNLPQWALVAMQCSMSSTNTERTLSLRGYLRRETDLTLSTIRTRCLLATMPRAEDVRYVPVRRGRKRNRNEDGDADPVAAAVVDVDDEGFDGETEVNPGFGGPDYAYGFFDESENSAAYFPDEAED